MNLSLQGEKRIEELLDLGLLSALTKLHARENTQLQKNALQAISYLTIGNRAHIELVLGTGLVPSILKLAEDPDKALEAGVVDMIHYMTCFGSSEHITYLIEHGVGAILCGAAGLCSLRRVAHRALQTLFMIDKQTLHTPLGAAFRAQLTPTGLRRLGVS